MNDSINITERVKSIDDICAIKGIKLAEYIPYPNPKNEDEENDNAYKTAKLIAEVLNEDKSFPDWNNSNQYKWFPVFKLKKDDSNPSGFRFLRSCYAYTLTHSGSGSRLCLKSEMLSDFAAKTFPDVYRKLIY